MRWNSLRRFIYGFEWNAGWKSELTKILEEVQQGLPLNMIIVISRESDFYGELLYLLSFLGMTLGSIVGYLFARYTQEVELLLLGPVLGFSAGSSLFYLRHFFINRVAPKAVKDKVNIRAKAQFFDYYRQLKERVLLIYISESERETIVLVSPEIQDYVPIKELERVLLEMISRYSSRRPMEHLRPALLKIGEKLRQSLANEQSKISGPMIVGASDSSLQAPRIVILKNNKDIN